MSIESKIERLERARESIKSAIRAKGVTVPEAAKIDALAALIGEIETGTDTSDATATASDILSGKTAYGAEGKLTGAMDTKSGETYTPSTTNQVIAAGQYLTGDQTILGDADLVPGNIKKDVVIFGVAGTYSGTDTSDATASASDILAGKTAYGASGKLTGSITSKTASDVTVTGNSVSVPAGYYGTSVTKSVGTAKAAETYTPGTADQTIAAGQYLSGAQTIKGDADLVAGNIKKDVQIFGVTGTFEGGTDISDTTATAADVLSPKKFHLADGTLKTGTIATKTGSDVTASGATVTVPAGYYASQVQKSVASGTAGTPTATKSAVSNHSMTVTPKVTNVTGYITGGEKTGTAVTVTASELVSGTKSITENGTADVTGYASVSVNVARPTLYAPTISLYGSLLTVSSGSGSNNGSFATSVKVLSGSETAATLSWPTSNNKINLAEVFTAPGTYTVSVKFCGTNFNESAASNSVTYTVAATATVEVTCSVRTDDKEPSANCYVKFGSAPTFTYDYDLAFGNDSGDSTLAYIVDAGTRSNIGDGGSWTKTYTTSDVYVWGGTAYQYFTASFNDTVIDRSDWGESDIRRAWTDPAHLTVDSNSTLDLECTVFQGSWD